MLRKSFIKLWLRYRETWQDISKEKGQKISLSDLWWIITFIDTFFSREMIIIQPQQSSILKVKHNWHHFGTEQFGLKLSEPKIYHKIIQNFPYIKSYSIFKVQKMKKRAFKKLDSQFLKNGFDIGILVVSFYSSSCVCVKV